MGQHWEDRDEQSLRMFVAHLDGKPHDPQWSFGDVVGLLVSLMFWLLQAIPLYAWFTSK
jgi:hypothetical protein